MVNEEATTDLGNNYKLETTIKKGKYPSSIIGDEIDGILIPALEITATIYQNGNPIYRTIFYKKTNMDLSTFKQLSSFDKIKVIFKKENWRKNYYTTK